MGTLIDGIYKNVFLTPEESEGLLQVFLLKHTLSKGEFVTQANKDKVANISVVAGTLSQKDFNDLVITIGSSTNKPTWISFMPDKNEFEKPTDAYKRYADNFINPKAKNVKDFPSNIFINNVFVEDKHGEIKKRTL